jgi:hypothetical protein
MPDTDKIRERLSEASDYDKHMALEKVLDECEQLQNSDNAGLVKSVLANKVIYIIQNELCEEVE